MRILFLGDIVGRAGRHIVQHFVHDLRRLEGLHFVVANGENAAGGKGIDQRTAQELFASGVDLITGGNHSWDKREVIPYIAKEPRLLRPANYPEIELHPTPGKGYAVLESFGFHLGVVNLMGRVHMEPVLECPFQSALKHIEMFHAQGIHNILVDFHAEATSEKQAMGHFLAGKVSAVIGTHSHVQTADERILVGVQRTTAYITDAGMTGPYDSVIGMQKEVSIQKFLTRMPSKYEPAEGRPGLHGVIIDIDTQTGSAQQIVRVSKFLN